MQVTVNYLGTNNHTVPSPLNVMLIEHDVPQIHVGWGDRDSGDGVDVWTVADSQGVAMSTRGGAFVAVAGGVRYPAEMRPAWADAFDRAVVEIRSAIQADRISRPEVEATCAAYDKIIADMRAEHAAHYRQWDRDVVAIAKLFRRRKVHVGEQTVPGKCVVRSTRGNTLGYAHVWDGKFLGTVEKVAR
jgi:hypothetical protein